MSEAVFVAAPPALGAPLLGVTALGVPVLVAPVLVAPSVIFLVTVFATFEPTLFTTLLVIVFPMFDPIELVLPLRPVPLVLLVRLVSLVVFLMPVPLLAFLSTPVILSVIFFTPVSTIDLPIFEPMVLALPLRPVPLLAFLSMTLPVESTAVFLPVNLSITNLVPAPSAAPVNALVIVLPSVEPEEPVVLVPAVPVFFTPVTLPTPVPVEVKVLPVAPVVPAVLEVRLGNFEVLSAAVVPAVFVPAVAPVEPFRADVTAFLG